MDIVAIKNKKIKKFSLLPFPRNVGVVSKELVLRRWGIKELIEEQRAPTKG